MSRWNPQRLLSIRQPSQTPTPCANLKIQLGTPTAIFQGAHYNGGGAYVPARLLFNVEEPVQVERLEVEIRLHTRYKRPQKKNCPGCSQQSVVISGWNIISNLTSLPQGQHDMDMSFAIPSNLPISMDTHLATVEYQLHAKALCTELEPIVSTKVFKVERVLEAETSKRLHVYNFTSTAIKASLSLDGTARPTGTNPVHIRIDNISTSIAVGFEVWKLKKLSWTLEESVSITPPDCPRHPASQQQSETRLLRKKSLVEGWQEHLDGPQHHIAFAFNYSLSRGGSIAAYVCDEGAGPEVKHGLRIELYLEKHLVLPGSPDVASPPRATTTLKLTRPVVLVELVETSAPPAYGESSERLPEYDDVSN